jgi:hypothetical protein
MVAGSVQKLKLALTNIFNNSKRLIVNILLRSVSIYWKKLKVSIIYELGFLNYSEKIFILD